MEQHQSSVKAHSPSADSDYSITVFGTPDGYDGPERAASCSIQFWVGAACFSLSMRPEDARALASQLALASLRAETPEACIIDLYMMREAA